MFLSSYGQTGTGKTFTMEGEKSSEGGSWDEVRTAYLFQLTIQYISSSANLLLILLIK